MKYAEVQKNKKLTKYPEIKDTVIQNYLDISIFFSKLKKGTDKTLNNYGEYEHE